MRKISFQESDSIFSAAKINLGLKVLYRRSSDLLHEIESIFIPISFGDRIDIRVQVLKDSHNEESMILNPSESTCISHEGSKFCIQAQFGMPKTYQKELEEIFSKDPTQNLLAKAWMKILPFVQPSLWECKIQKNIPAGSGLGGGSSNAGAFLRFAIENCEVPKPLAVQWAKELGADVPFFIGCQPSWVTGIGDRIEPIQVGQGWGILHPPGIFFSTRRMYDELKKTLQIPLPSKTWKEQERDLVLAVEKGDWISLRGRLENDFERVAFQIEPHLGSLCKWFLENGASYASMTGSGSAIYALFSHEAERDQALNRWRTYHPEKWFIPFSFPIGLSPSGKASVFGTDIS